MPFIPRLNCGASFACPSISLSSAYNTCVNLPYKEFARHYLTGHNGVKVFGWGAAGCITALGPLLLINVPLGAAVAGSFAYGIVKMGVNIVNIKESEEDAADIEWLTKSLKSHINRIRAEEESDCQTKPASDATEITEQKIECMDQVETPRPVEIIEKKIEVTIPIQPSLPNTPVTSDKETIVIAAAAPTPAPTKKISLASPANRRLSLPNVVNGIVQSRRGSTTRVQTQAEQVAATRKKKMAEDRARAKKKIMKKAEALIKPAGALRTKTVRKDLGLSSIAVISSKEKEKASEVLLPVVIDTLPQVDERKIEVPDSLRSIQATLEPKLEVVVGKIELPAAKVEELSPATPETPKQLADEKSSSDVKSVDCFQVFAKPAAALVGSLNGGAGGYTLFSLITRINPNTSSDVYVPLAVLSGIAFGLGAGFFASREKQQKLDNKMKVSELKNVIGEIDSISDETKEPPRASVSKDVETPLEVTPRKSNKVQPLMG